MQDGYSPADCKESGPWPFFALLYSLIYLLLRLEDNALLVGAIASFLAVSAAMYFTRTIDWYGSLPAAGISEKPGATMPQSDTA